jgi:DNA polymerase-3 subunit epsilon
MTVTTQPGITGAVFDLETTGTNPLEARIVTAYLAPIGPDGSVDRSTERMWLLDPGEHHSDAAAEIHGWTPERLAGDPRTVSSHPAKRAQAIHSIAAHLHALTARDALPVMAHNAAYDLTVLNAELVRSGYPELVFGDVSGIYVLDSLVLDRHFEKYVKGSGQRKLLAAAARYGVALTAESAHDARVDAIACGRILQVMFAKRTQYLSANGPAGLARLLYESQMQWYADQQAGLEQYFRDNHILEDDGSPIITSKTWPALPIPAKEETS